jgi:hypothetical protein
VIDEAREAQAEVNLNRHELSNLLPSAVDDGLMIRLPTAWRSIAA